jgi:hypothetical protein
MLIIINLLILCIVLFVYIHIYHHIKTSNYLEIYEIENPSKDKLEDLTAMKQPLVINNITLNNMTLDYLKSNYPTFELSLYNKVNDLFVKIKLEEFCKLIMSKDSYNILTYNNYEFLEETTIDKHLEVNDLFLRPYNMLSKKYDILMGSVKSVTQLKYSINSRNILYVSHGKIEVTLCPPKDYKHLHVKKNHETLEFYSQINIYDVEQKYYNDYNKVKFLRIQLVPNQVLLIPPYWFYSIKILELNTLVFYNTYRTYAGTVAIIPDLFMQLLQQDNLKLNITKHFANISIVKESELKGNNEQSELKGNNEESELKDNNEQSELKDNNEQSELKDNNEQSELKDTKDI